MFQSISYSSKNEPVDGICLHRYYFDITDTDFGTEQWAAVVDGSIALDISAGALAVINCYASKGQNVAFNLALHHRNLLIDRSRNHLFSSIERIMQYIPEYRQYANEVERYLDRFDRQAAFE